MRSMIVSPLAISPASTRLAASPWLSQIRAAYSMTRKVDPMVGWVTFAAGFLVGEARGLGLERSLKLGAIAAAEVIQHYGARPEADLKALAGDLLG